MRRGALRAHFDIGRLYSERPAVAHGVPCVEREIDQHLFELRDVHLGGDQQLGAGERRATSTS